MKNKISKILFCIVLITVSFVSCEWIDDDLNIDPDSPDDLTIDLLLSASQVSMAYTLGGFDIAGVSSMWMRYIIGLEQQAQKINDFIFLEKDVSNVWDNIYGTLNDLNEIIRKANETSDKSPYYEGIAKVMKAHLFGTLTQLWGDIPFSEALQGDANLHPKYDAQKDVYEGIQQLLDEAIIALNVDEDSNAYDVKGDLIYGIDKNGNTITEDETIKKWKKAAYSLKLRYYLHLSKVTDTVYNRIVTLYEEDSTRFFTSYDDDFQLYFGDAENEKNPMFQFDEQRGDAEKNTYFDGFLSTKRPAQAIQFWNNYLISGETFAGLFYGERSSPVTFMSHSELQFIVAEARDYTGDKSKAKNSLQLGVQSFMDKISLSNDEANLNAWMTRYDNQVIQWINDNDIREEILEQKYIALYLNPEAFVDWRRTGIPDDIEVDTEDEQRIMPRRFPYSSKERLYNNNIPSVSSIYARNWIDPE